MMLNKTSVYDIIDIIIRLVGYTPYTISHNINRLIIASPDNVFNKIIETVRKRKIDIISVAGNRYVASTLIHILSNAAPDIRRAVRVPPEEIRDILREYIKYLDGKRRDKPVIDGDTAMILSKYFFVSLTKNVGIDLVIMPTPSELALYTEYVKKNTARPYNEELLDVIKDVYLDTGLVEYDAETHEVKVSGIPIYRIDDEAEFLKRSRNNRLRLIHIVRYALIVRLYNNIRRRLSALGINTVQDNRYRETLKTRGTADELGEKLGVNTPEELHGREATIEITYLSSEAQLLVSVSVAGRVRNVVEEKLGLHETGRIVELLRELFRTAANNTIERDKVLGLIDKRLTDNGFEKTEPAYGGIAYGYRRGSYNIVVEVSSEIHDKTPKTPIIIRAEFEKEINEQIVKKHLRKNGYPVSDMMISADNKVLIIWNTTATTSNVEDITEKILGLENILWAARKEYLEKKKRGAIKVVVKNPKNLDSFAAYLAFLYDPLRFPTSIDYKKMMSNARNFLLESSGNKKIKKIIKGGIKERYHPLMVHMDTVLLELFITRKLVFDKDKIILFGEDLGKIYERLGFSPETTRKVEKRIAEELTASISRLEPERLAARIGGRTVWDMLPENIKQLYIESITTDNIAKILGSPHLMSVFSDVIDKIIEKALQTKDPVLKTIAVCRFRPEILGTRYSVTITREAGVPAINAGMFLVHIYRLGEKTEYIVYRKDRKIGILYTGKTLVEAISKAVKTYDEASRKAEWTADKKIRLGDLVLPTKNGEPIRGDREKTSAEALVAAY